MKRVLITTWMVAAAMIGLAAVAEGESSSKPFVHITTSPDRLDLGTTLSPGLHNVSKALTVKVDSNCLHGPITISATTLRHHMGASIPPEHIFVKSNMMNGFVTMERPVTISQPMLGPHKIVLDLQVQTGFNDLAGRYKGVFTVTVMPPV